MEILPLPIIYFNLLLSLSLSPYSIFPVTRAPVIFSRSFDHATMNLATRYSNGVIPRVPARACAGTIRSSTSARISGIG